MNIAVELINHLRNHMLAALVIYEGLYGQSCIGLPAIGVTAEDAKVLQDVASEVRSKKGTVPFFAGSGKKGDSPLFRPLVREE